MLRGWVFQLLARDEPLMIGHAVKAFKLSHLPSASIPEMSALLRNISEVNGGLRLIIDSFDEYSVTERHEILYLLAQLGSSVTAIFFSRDSAELYTSWMNNTSTIRLSTDDTSPDVDAVIERGVKALFANDEELENSLVPRITSAVSKKAAGLHIYARLLLDTLSTQTTVTELLAAVEQYPVTLDRIYANITAAMESLPSHQLKRVYRILQFVVCGRASLTAAALREAISIDRGMTILDADQMVINIRDLIGLCRPLLHLHEPTGEVTVTHASVRDFFLRRRGEARNAQNEPEVSFSFSNGLSEAQCHAEIASACLIYLTLDRSISRQFFSYAARHWSYHLAQCGQGPWSGKLVEQVVSFFGSEKRFFWMKYASDLEGRQWGGRLLSCQAELRRFLGSAPSASKSVKKVLESSLVSLYAEFVSSTEKQQGPSHLQTIAALQSLAVMYGWTGDAAKSVKILESLLARQGIGNSLLRLEILIELGTVYHALRRFDDSVAVLKEAGERRKKEIGEEDSISLKAHDRLAGVYQSQGKYPLAEKMYTRSLTMRMAIDPCHPETLVVANNLGLLYKAQKRWAESEKLLRHVLSSHETLYGREHPTPLWSSHHLASVLVMQERWDEGIALARWSYDGLKLLVGEESNQTIAARLSIARYNMAHDRLREAIVILEFALKVSTLR